MSNAELNDKWKQLSEEAIERLNIKDEYEAMGVKFASSTPNSKGWLQCHAYGREDNTPSAGVNVGNGPARGRYKDFGIGESLSLFDFMKRAKGLASWRDARNEVIEKAGLKKRMPRTRDILPTDRLDLVSRRVNATATLALERKNPEQTLEAFQLAGAVTATYPAKAYSPTYVIGLPIYGQGMLDDDPTGYVVMSQSGMNINVYKGPNSPPESHKRITIGTSGMLNKHAMKHWHEAELIWKVEGVSDMLALQSIIPPELRDKHLVTTNAGGTHETQLVSAVAHWFAGKKVVVLHDCDKPGQEGAEFWVKTLQASNATVGTVLLPYEIEEKKGKDLRDWIKEGHTYEQLLGLVKIDAHVAGAAEVEQEESAVCPYESAIKQMGITVFGQVAESSRIICYSEKLKRIAPPISIEKLKYEQAVQYFGSIILDNVGTNATDYKAGKISFRDFKVGLSLTASRRQTVDGSEFAGMGIWAGERNEYLTLVNRGHIVTWNGRLKKSDEPMFGSKLVRWNCEKWFDYEQLETSLKMSESREWCESVFREAESIFKRWNNLVHPFGPQLITALVFCSFVQTVWRWRPIVYILGPSSSGKTLLLKTIKDLFGPLAFSSALSSEAGIRQTIGADARVIIMDEFERTTDREKIFSALKTSGRGDNSAKGTTTQKSLVYGYRHIPWMASIESGISRAADLNRIIQIDLAHPPKGALPLKIESTEVLNALGSKMLAVVMRHWKRAFDLCDILTSKFETNIERRLIESFSAPVAMMAAINGFSEQECMELMGAVLSKDSTVEDQETDEHSLMSTILSSVVRVGRGSQATIGSLLFTDRPHDFEERPSDVLGRFGITLLKSHGSYEERVFFVWKLMRSLMKGTEFEGMKIRDILLRIEGAGKFIARVQGIQHNGVTVPTSWITENYRNETLSEITM